MNRLLLAASLRGPVARACLLASLALLGAAALVALLGTAHRFLIPHPTPGETFHEQH